MIFDLSFTWSVSCPSCCRCCLSQLRPRPLASNYLRPLNLLLCPAGGAPPPAPNAPLKRRCEVWVYDWAAAKEIPQCGHKSEAVAKWERVEIREMLEAEHHRGGQGDTQVTSVPRKQHNQVQSAASAFAGITSTPGTFQCGVWMFPWVMGSPASSHCPLTRMWGQGCVCVCLWLESQNVYFISELYDFILCYKYIMTKTYTFLYFYSLYLLGISTLATK